MRYPGLTDDPETSVLRSSGAAVQQRRLRGDRSRSDNTRGAHGIDGMLQASDIVTAFTRDLPKARSPHSGNAINRTRTIMIKVYAFSTPNSVRVPIGLEELGLDYDCSRSMSAKANRNYPHTWH